MHVENEVLGQNQQDEHHLTRKETRQIVTPYAFHVSPELFGTALARPIKRAIAIGIDALLIAMLSQSASFLLAGVAAVTFFRAGNRLKLKKRFNAGRLALRFIAASLLFIFALGVFDTFELNQSKNEGATDYTEISGKEALAVVAVTTKYMLSANALVEKVDSGECPNTYLCWQSLGNDLVESLIELALPEKEALDILEGLLDMAEKQLSAQEKSAMLRQWQDQLKFQEAELDNKLVNKSAGQMPAESLASDQAVPTPEDESDATNEQKEPSILAWFEGIMEDLGLGFGWAAFYFSIFTAWLRGQTPGKKLLGIKVIKLDGKEPNLWESFGRYGGYGAGFATGLLGFLQVYWDPNRQAIQDKISHTVVIDLRIAKIDFIPENQSA
ncbi:RDD family protein [Flavobacterium sp. W21_SRS_FM6]|uniref:RDD family protein n=1 Tax=Flavobacterium sp. W21_SRS_FM6 TaxID=3240268 RepID=UPI003F93E653